MSTDDRDVQIQTIETHLRRLGLTEKQISLHVRLVRLNFRFLPAGGLSVFAAFHVP